MVASVSVRAVVFVSVEAKLIELLPVLVRVVFAPSVTALRKESDPAARTAPPFTATVVPPALKEPSALVDPTAPVKVTAPLVETERSPTPADCPLIVLEKVVVKAPLVMLCEPAVSVSASPSVVFPASEMLPPITVDPPEPSVSVVRPESEPERVVTPEEFTVRLRFAPTPVTVLEKLTAPDPPATVVFAPSVTGPVKLTVPAVVAP